MSGAMISIELDDRHIHQKIRDLIAFGRDTSDVMQDIAQYGETSTRRRFELQMGPDDKRWKPSIRAQITGGKTLTKDRHLGDSINSTSSASEAQWGVNRIYAAIHQFGGNAGRKLRTKIMARPYLGVNAQDEGFILRKIQRAIEEKL